MEKKLNNSFEKIEKYKIKQRQIKELDNLLEDNNDNKNNYSEFFVKINSFIENSKKIYSKLGKSKIEKEKLIVLFLENICFLINNLNIRRVHNRSCGLELKDFEKIEELQDYFRVRGKDFLNDNKKGFSCNNINVFVYTLIKEIIGNDDFKSYFLLNKIDNHGRFVLNFTDADYTFDSNSKGVFLLKNKKNNNFFEKIDTLEEYKKEVIEQEKKYNTIKYQYGRYVLILEKKGTKINLYYQKYPLGIKIKNKIGKKIVNYLHQRISKVFSYKKGDFNQVGDLIDYLNILLPEEDGKVIKQIFSNIHKEKITQFL